MVVLLFQGKNGDAQPLTGEVSPVRVGKVKSGNEQLGAGKPAENQNDAPEE